MKSNRQLRRYGVPPEISLTDGLSSVVSRRPRRNRLWAFVTSPFRFIRGCYQWLMESRPSDLKSRRRPPGFQ